jgi:uncharacterized protein HemY
MSATLIIILCVLALPVIVFVTIFVRQLRAGGGKAMSFGKSRKRDRQE